MAFRGVVPPRDLVMEFERRITAVDSRIKATVQETPTLSTLRDTLLPKLISGELRVPDAGRMWEGQ